MVSIADLPSSPRHERTDDRDTQNQEPDLPEKLITDVVTIKCPKYDSNQLIGSKLTHSEQEKILLRASNIRYAHYYIERRTSSLFQKRDKFLQQLCGETTSPSAACE